MNKQAAYELGVELALRNAGLMKKEAIDQTMMEYLLAARPGEDKGSAMGRNMASAVGAGGVGAGAGFGAMALAKKSKNAKIRALAELLGIGTGAAAGVGTYEGIHRGMGGRGFGSLIPE